MERIKIVYYNKNIAFCVKPPFVSSEGEGMPKLLKEALGEQGIKTEVYPLHRLDTAVSGLMIFALNKETAGKLGKEIAQGKGIKKEYLAVVQGSLEEKQGLMEDLLFKDSRKNKSFVVKRERKGVKKASLEYKVIVEKEGFSLVKILLHTGRTHQIRVQFSSRKHPLVGDGKYGSKNNCNIALFSHKITLSQGESYEEYPPDIYPWNLFNDFLNMRNI